MHVGQWVMVETFEEPMRICKFMQDDPDGAVETSAEECDIVEIDNLAQQKYWVAPGEITEV
jgi:hypothetical protein